MTKSQKYIFVFSAACLFMFVGTNLAIATSQQSVFTVSAYDNSASLGLLPSGGGSSAQTCANPNTSLAPSSGIQVAAGDVISGSASGSWSNNPGTALYGPDGSPYDNSVNCTGFQVGKLVMKLVANDCTTTWFGAGTNFSTTIPKTGMLYFAFSDGDQTNNRGSVSVSMSIQKSSTSVWAPSDGQCGTQHIVCSSNSDCGANTLTGSPYCGNSGNVYQNYINYTCTNPGTASSACTNANVAQLVTTCTANQSCLSGACVNQHITCSSNSDCGTNAYTGSAYCGTGGNVYQNYITYTCNNPGTATSSCSNNSAPQLKTNCTSGQTCSNGSCGNQNITCSANTDCGTNAYTGSAYCGTGGNVYQNYITYTCNNPGTATSSCSNNSAAQLKTTCSGNQSCNNGYCNGQNCSYHSYQQCNGNYLYWYDSCGNQQDSQYCPNGCYGNTCQNYNNNNNVSVQTMPATNVVNNQATLNGYLYNNSYGNYSYNNYNYNNNNNCSTYVWFQYGPTSNYGSETNHVTQNYSGNFSQIAYINNSYYGGAYHFRAAAQTCNGNIAYGNDTTVYANNPMPVPVNGNLITNKTVRNLTTGSGFSTSTYASPGDTLMFMITLQASGQDVQNVFVRDTLPANLIYENQLVIACTANNSNYNNCNSNSYNNYSGDITSGINLNTIYSGQTVTITYQAQIASAQNFAYGSTTLTNNVNVTSSNTGYIPTSNASVIVTRAGVYGASTVSTGLTNNFWTDSFFLPLLITLFGLWLWKTGAFFGIEKWLAGKKKNKTGYDAEKELSERIASIHRLEGVR